MKKEDIEDTNVDEDHDLQSSLEHHEGTNEEDEHATLPSRSEIHQQKQQKNTFKIKYPVIKLLALFFILLPIVIYSWVTFGASQKAKEADGTQGNNSSYETVGVDNDKDKNTSLDINEPADDEKEQPGGDADVENEDVSSGDTPGADANEPKQPQTGQGDVTTGKDDKPVEKPSEQRPETAPPVEDPKLVYHTVKANETLYRISMNYFQSQEGINIIKNANNLRGDEIRVGQVLKIPLK